MRSLQGNEQEGVRLMEANRDLSLRDIVRVPGKGVGRTVAILEPAATGAEASVTVELPFGERWSGPVWVVKILRPDYINRSYVDGSAERAEDGGAQLFECPKCGRFNPAGPGLCAACDDPPADYRCKYCGGPSH